MNHQRIAWIVVLLIVLEFFVYWYDIVRGRVTTTLVTWLVTTVATGLIMVVVYLRNGNLNMKQNASLVTGFVVLTLITGVVYREDASVEWTQFHTFVTVVSVAGFVLYIWQRRHALASVLVINAAIVIGFIPMWVGLWHGSVAESLPTWTLVFVSSLLATISIVVDRKDGHLLTVVFPARAAATSGVVIVMSLWNMFWR